MTRYIQENAYQRGRHTYPGYALSDRVIGQQRRKTHRLQRPIFIHE